MHNLLKSALVTAFLTAAGAFSQNINDLTIAELVQLIKDDNSRVSSTYDGAITGECTTGHDVYKYISEEDRVVVIAEGDHHSLPLLRTEAHWLHRFLPKSVHFEAFSLEEQRMLDGYYQTGPHPNATGATPVTTAALFLNIRMIAADPDTPADKRTLLKQHNAINKHLNSQFSQKTIKKIWPRYPLHLEIVNSQKLQDRRERVDPEFANAIINHIDTTHDELSFFVIGQHHAYGTLQSIKEQRPNIGPVLIIHLQPVNRMAWNKIKGLGMVQLDEHFILPVLDERRGVSLKDFIARLDWYYNNDTALARASQIVNHYTKSQYDPPNLINALKQCPAFSP